MDVLTLAGRQASTQGSHELKTLFRYLSTSPIKEMRFARILIEKERSHSRDGVHPKPSAPPSAADIVGHQTLSDL